jgi:hypothetical protein
MIQPEREIDGLNDLRLLRAFYRRAGADRRQAGLTRIAMLGFWHGAVWYAPKDYIIGLPVKPLVISRLRQILQSWRQRSLLGELHN